MSVAVAQAKSDQSGVYEREDLLNGCQAVAQGVRLAEEIGVLFGYDLASQPFFVMRQVRAMARYDQAGGLFVSVPECRRSRYELAVARIGHALGDLIALTLVVDPMCRGGENSVEGLVPAAQEVRSP